MPSLYSKGSLRWVRFTLNRHRKAVRLGKMSEKGALMVLAHICELHNAHRGHHPIAGATAAWLENVDLLLRKRIALTGLIPGKVAGPDLSPMLKQYLARRTDLKAGTRRHIAAAIDSLTGFFGAAKEVAAITSADAKDWRRHLVGIGYAPATVSSRVKKAKQIFDDAVERDLIKKSPFDPVKSGGQSNDARKRYVSLEQIEAVIAKCPDAQWRLVFALARLGGIRIPSELKALTWADIDWASAKILIHSRKTEHIEGRATRWIPLFEELEPYLLDCFGDAKPRTDHVCTIGAMNLRTRARKIIKRAGIEPWPRLFNNLRSSCETDLTARFPLHVVCAWIGNREAVALKHYLQVTEAHFAAASGSARKSKPAPGPVSALLTGPEAERTLTEALTAASMTPTGLEPLIERGVNLQNAHRECQKAYHSTLAEMASLEKESLAAIQRGIDLARSRGGRR